MFKGHPKGLYVLFFTEMWERFGFYTVLAIFVYYLSENFGWSQAEASSVYGIYIALIYVTPILGGWIADNFLGYGRTIIIGSVILIAGYAMLAFPTNSVLWLYIAIGILALGNGLFKANISVLVGNLYSKDQGALKDSGYNIFYLGINIGAFFAPFAASGIKNFFLNSFDATLAQAYNAGFAVASAGMIISILIFTSFRKHYKTADYQSKNAANDDKDIKMTKKQEWDRIWALIIVYIIVVFFWMAFHQNGAAIAFFARDYAHEFVSRLTYLLFDLGGLLGVLGIISAVILLIRKNSSGKVKGISAIGLVLASALAYWRYTSFGDTNLVDPELYQAFNPLFIVFLTPVVIGFWAWLGTLKKEPSTPKKIAIGMLIIGMAFVVLTIASTGLPGVYSLDGAHSSSTVSPYWLVSTFLFLTLGELCISPMGLSLVSKVAPPRFRGLMMGLWFGSTALGNLLVGLIGTFYENWELWQFWTFLVVTSVIAAIFILLFSKKLEKVTESKNEVETA